MGWELEARLAERGAHELDVDSLMRLAKKNDDVKTIIKLEAIKAMSSDVEKVNVDFCRRTSVSR